ncbi:glycoside hydrolase family 105 protein, partial [Pectobacterium versatile]|nr:glycoside hydrolase family 105 protein [Pectobacterium versatile]
FLIQVLESQVEALAKYQDDSGLWHTLLDDPNSYLESSATAGFAYGILKAVRKRYIDRCYAEVADKAMRGVVANISENGELLNVSFGTAMGKELDYYRQIPLTSM